MSNSLPQPTKLPSNQFDHFYKGEYRIGKLRNGPGGPMRPEEWIGSTTTRFGESVNGLSRLPSGKLLKDEINANPNNWLGEKHIQKFGVSTEVLVKLLDPDQRLPVHYHPDQKFSKEKLQLNHGKTEAWIVLDAPKGARVGVGFKEVMKKQQVAELVKNHDSTGLLNSLEFKEVKAGDAVFVPAGVAHAIEAGIFVLELQEPTDLSILLEWDGFAVDGDKDGKIDLRNSPEDAIASVGNFLKMHGWIKDEPIYLKINANDETLSIAKQLADGEPKAKLQLSQLIKEKLIEPNALPETTPSLVVDLPSPAKNGDTEIQYVIGLRNFIAICDYNRSFFYAQSVAEFADALRGTPLAEDLITKKVVKKTKKPSKKASTKKSKKNSPT